VPVIVTGSSITPSQLFIRCRQALNLQRDQLQDELCLMDLSTVEKIERGAIDVHGTTWVSLHYLLTNAIRRHPRNIDELRALCDHITEHMTAIRTEAARRRARSQERRAAAKETQQ
jgi:hypothetical protein